MRSHSLFSSRSIKPLEIETEAKSQPTFHYLKMEEGEFKNFRKTLPEKIQQISQVEAEEILKKNKGRFSLEYALDFTAVATNGLFPVWLVNTGSSGFILCASLLSGLSQESLEQNPVLNKTSAVVIWISSLLAAAQWIFMYSPWTQAAKDTLIHASSEMNSLLERMKTTVVEAWRQPRENTSKLLGFLAFQLFTYLININSASTEIFFTPAGLNWFPALLIIFFATRYVSQVWNESLKDGIKFWTDRQNNTSILEQIKKGNVAIAFKILSEGLGSTILKGLIHFFIAERNQKSFGIWASPGLLLGCGLIHGLLINYPTAFKNEIAPFELLERLLTEKLSVKIDAFMEEQLKILSRLDAEQKNQYLKLLVKTSQVELVADTLRSNEYKAAAMDLEHKLEEIFNLLIKLIPGDPRLLAGSLTAEAKMIPSTAARDLADRKLEFKKRIIQFNMELIETHIKKQGRLKLLAKDPLSVFTIILNTLFGGYAGYKLLSPAFSTVMPAAASIPLTTALGALTIGGFYSKAVTQTEMKKAACEELNVELRQQHSLSASSHLKFASFALAASGALSSGLSTIGAAGSAVKDSTLGVAAVVFASTQKMINDARYSEPYLYKTLKEQIASVGEYYKNSHKLTGNPLSYAGVRFWGLSPKSEMIFAENKPSPVRFWKADNMPEYFSKEKSFIERSKLEF